MQCPGCQHENPPQAKFCLECGARLALTCAKCQSELPPSAKFCLECGEPVGGRPAAEPRFGSPESYTPKHLAEKILISKSALEGERKQVTVLFADLKGSMELLADRDPEEARKILDPVLERMMEAVHHYEGTVNQVMGDGIMALFGAPLAHEDHAVRACYAALRMQESVRRYAEEVQRTAGVPIQIRVGLNSGEVVVRSIGSDLRMDYTAVGQTTHLAARMEQMAMAGSILITGDTLRLAEGYVLVKPLGPVPVKGLDTPVEVYEVIGAGAVRTRLQASAARGLTRFVGRDAEIEQLRRALEKAGQGHGQIAAVVGEPGVGKSRLFYEFARSHRTQAWLLLESGSVSYGKATAYLPVIELLKTYFEIETRDDTRKVREKVTGKLLTLDRSHEPILPALLALLDVPTEDSTWQALDPPQRRQRTLDAVKRLLVRESQVQPLLLIFEDLHWIDTETQSLLDSLIESLPTSRVLLLVNYRPEYQHSWGSKTYYSQLRLDALPPESAGELLHALLGAAPELAPLKQILITRTEGNPFFLEESVRTLVETKALVGERGAYRWPTPSGTIQVPATVRAVLASRIDRLPAEEKRLLQAASVIGKDVPYTLLQAIAALPEEALRRGLIHLQAAEFLYEASLFPDLEYTFKHALTHEVAYGSLLQDRRRALHAAVLKAMESLYHQRVSEYVERLAHHAFHGEAWPKAASYFRRAGIKAAQRSAHREAVACFEQALAALQHLPETRETVEHAIDLRFDLRQSLNPLAQYGRILTYLREAEGLAQAIEDTRRLGWISSYLAQLSWIMGQPDEAVRSGERALSLANALGEFALQVANNFYLGRSYQALGEYDRAIDFFQRNVTALQGDLRLELFGVAGLPSALSRTWLAWCLAERGEFADAAARAQGAVELAENGDHPFTLAGAHMGVGIACLYRGLVDQAVSALERALRLCHQHNFPVWFPWIASFLGSAYALVGRLDEALSYLAQAVDQAASMSRRVDHALFVLRLGEATLLAGDVARALEHARLAADLAREHKERPHEAYCERLLGAIAEHREPPDLVSGEAHYQRAMALARALGMRPLGAHCQFGLGRLYRRTGQREQAHEHLSAATTMYREMDMRFWLDQAEAEIDA